MEERIKLMQWEAVKHKARQAVFLPQPVHCLQGCSPLARMEETHSQGRTVIGQRGWHTEEHVITGNLKTIPQSAKLYWSL